MKGRGTGNCLKQLLGSSYYRPGLLLIMSMLLPMLLPRKLTCVCLLNV